MPTKIGPMVIPVREIGMRFGGGGALQMLAHGRFVLGAFLIALMIALALEMLATFNAKTRDLAGRPRWKLLSYWAFAIGVVAVIFLWVVMG
ncbi:MAG TPA: hypothetical protein VGM17_11165 [Rhizomicrobium sp.]|jgi:hypothetical protein